MAGKEPGVNLLQNKKLSMKSINLTVWHITWNEWLVRSCFFVMLYLLTIPAPAQSVEPTLAGHWSTPIIALGNQSGLDPSIQDLRPQACAACHTSKKIEWQTSRHSLAFSPGLLGQLLTFSTDDEVKSCLRCHTPLAEQQQQLLSLARPLAWNNSQPETPLADAGVFCAACHVRQGRIVGPLPRPETAHSGEFKPGNNGPVHAHKSAVTWFKESEFCAPCHQFPQSMAINGKPLENTVKEWQESPFASQGITCQGCHMPDQKHLFLGIHDQETVRSAVEITTENQRETAILTLRSTRIGHRFPTYIVPRITLKGSLLDSMGQPILGGEQQWIIQRQMAPEDGWQELSDTRIKPGQTAQVTVPWQVGNLKGTQIHFQIIIDPDHYYREYVYSSLLKSMQPGPGKDMIMRADAEARRNRYILFDQVIHQ